MKDRMKYYWQRWELLELNDYILYNKFKTLEDLFFG